MHFKKAFRKKVYHLYLKGIPIWDIADFLDIDTKSIDDIIDYMNMIFC